MSWIHTFALSALVLLSSCLTKDNPIVELPEDTKNPIQKTIDELPNVEIDQSKDDNWCTEDNVDKPEYDENMNPNHCFVSRESEPEM